MAYYKVKIMPPAKRRLDIYVGYTAEVLKNPQASKGIIADAKKTKSILSEVADTLPLCDNPILSKYEYRIMHFKKHRFLMIYRIKDNEVLVDGMYHELQDYESIFINDMGLI